MIDAPIGARLLLVRHGESNATVERRIGGMATCTGLSQLGLAQAERLRDRLAAGTEPVVDRLISSAMPRAIETCTALNQALGLMPTIDPDLEELRPGAADGMTFAAYIEAYGDIDHLDEPDRELAEAGESRTSFAQRVMTALAAHVEEQALCQLIVCHGGVIDVIVRGLLGVGLNDRFVLSSKNTALTELRRVGPEMRPQWQLGRFNDASHLVGLPSGSKRSES